MAMASRLVAFGLIRGDQFKSRHFLTLLLPSIRRMYRAMVIISILNHRLIYYQYSSSRVCDDYNTNNFGFFNRTCIRLIFAKTPLIPSPGNRDFKNRPACAGGFLLHQFRNGDNPYAGRLKTGEKAGKGFRRPPGGDGESRWRSPLPARPLTTSPTAGGYLPSRNGPEKSRRAAGTPSSRAAANATDPSMVKLSTKKALAP